MMELICRGDRTVPLPMMRVVGRMTKLAVTLVG